VFCFRLARELGMTRAELLASTGSAELSEWMAFFALESRVQELVSQQVHPTVAAEMVWAVPEDE
jgi:hypothetical protein